MRYSIQKAVRMMAANRKVYLRIIVEIALITGVLVLADTAQKSAEDELARLSGIFSEEEVFLTFYPAEGASGQDLPEAGITKQDAAALRNSFSDIALRYYICDSITFYDDGNFEDFYLVWIADAHPGVQAGQMGQKAAELLGERLHVDGVRLIGDPGMNVSRGNSPASLYIEGKEYLFEASEINFVIPTVVTEIEIEGARCLFLPLEERPDDWEQTNVNTVCGLRFGDIGRASERIGELFSFLSERHEGRFFYRYSNVLDEYTERADGILDEITLFAFIAKLCLCVVIFGVAGVMSIFVRKRKKEYAVACAVGAGKGNIRLELLAEVFGVSCAGSLCGSVIGVLLLMLPLRYAFPLRFSPSCLSAPCLVALSVPLLAGIAVISDVNAINPIETMKDE